MMSGRVTGVQVKSYSYDNLVAIFGQILVSSLISFIAAANASDDAGPDILRLCHTCRSVRFLFEVDLSGSLIGIYVPFLEHFLFFSHRSKHFLRTGHCEQSTAGSVTVVLPSLTITVPTSTTVLD